jgi:hypothetical protein
LRLPARRPSEAAQHEQTKRIVFGFHFVVIIIVLML